MTESLGISFDRWRATIENVRDKDKVFELGRWAYQEFYGDDVSSHTQNLELLRILARLLHRAFESLASNRLVDLKQCLEGRGRFFETTFWEHPAFRAQAHALLELEAAKKRLPTLLELLLIAHDLEGSIRPNLLRIAWVAKLSTGDGSTSYSDSQLNSEGLQGSLGYARDEISTWLESKADEVLSVAEIQEVKSFVDSLFGQEPDQASADDLRNWPAHRDFTMGARTLVMNFHPSPGRRIPTDREAVTSWRRQTLGLMSLMHGFKVMFLAHAAARCDDIRPAFVPD